MFARLLKYPPSVTFPVIALFLALVFSGNHLSAAKDAPIDLGSRREIFVDHFLIEKLDGVELELQKPRSGGIAMRYDGMADYSGSFYTTVLKDGPLYRMYYRCIDPVDPEPRKDRSNTLTCYAESPDGIHWTRPSLGIYEVNGSRANNIIMPFGEPFTPFIDTRPGVPPSERYKANMEANGDHIIVVDPETSELALRAVGEGSPKGLMGFVSADGIHWRFASDKLILDRDLSLPNHLDGPNVMFWSEVEQQYVCYQRHIDGDPKGDGKRATVRTTSKDFLHWTHPIPMTYSDTGTTRPVEHMYVNNTNPYFRAPHIYISLQGRLFEGRRALTEAQAATVFPNPASSGITDIGDGVLLTTRPGTTLYDFTFRECFVRPGLGYENWSTRENFPVNGLVPTGKNEMSFYVQRHYTYKTACLERMVLRLDGFASVSAPYDGGELLTKPFTFSGKELEINYSTSAAGGIRVEIQDADGNQVKGFTFDDCPEIIGDEISRIVSWDRGTDLSGLIGKPVRLRFRMHDADLFSIRFRP